MKTESEGPDALDDFGRFEGIPSIIRSDNSKMQRYGKRFLTRLREWVCGAEFTEPHHPQQNPAELRVCRWLKEGIKILRMRTGAPRYVWLWAAKYLADIHNITADETLDWKTPWSKRKGETPDISAFLQFKFYERIYFLDPKMKFPETKERTGYWLGVAHNVGDSLTYVILTADTRQIIERSVIRSAENPKTRNNTLKFDPELEPNFEDTDEEIEEASDTDDQSIDNPDERIADPKPVRNKKELRRSKRRPRTDPTQPLPSIHETSQNKVEDFFDVNQYAPTTDRRRDPDAPRPANEDIPPVERRSLRNRKKVNSYGRMVKACAMAMFSTTSFLSTHFVEPPILTVPTISGLTMNTSSGETTATVPISGEPTYPSYAFSGITRFEKEQLEYVQELDLANEETSTDADDQQWKPTFVYKHRIQKRKGKRTLQVKVGWLFENPSWIDAAPLRFQNPFLLVDYTLRSNLLKHKDFSWVSEYAESPTRMDNLVRVFKANTDRNAPKYKFGIEVPRSIPHAFLIDKMNGDNMWKEAMDKELKQIEDYKTFRLLRKGEILGNYTRIPYHMVFDVKFDLRRKARLVAGGNHTDPPREDIYSGVVDIQTVRLGFMIAAQNGLSVCAADIGNAFLYGKTREKVYITAGREFGDLQGTPLIIDRGLYGLRSSAARFHEHLSEKLLAMGFRPSKADTDFWMKDMGTHYEYCACYVDDVLFYSLDPMALINELKRDYILKGIGQPEYYLGGDVVELDGTWRKEGIQTALSAKTYIKNVVSKFEQVFECEFKEAKSPMESSYHPESDDSEFLGPKEASLYRGLIGSANWMITLGRFDIHYATGAMARFSMAPREGHLKALLRVFGYLKKFPHGQLLVDPNPPDHDQFESIDQTWTEFYPDAEEELPPDLPIPKGKPARTTCYVDADHAHDVVTRRSVTGVLLFFQSMPVKWLSKRQKTVETSSYGSELVAARVAVELIIELRYKLRMLGVPVNEPTLMLGDNMSVILNTTVPSSQLKKKHNAIAYHRVREAIAGKVVKFVHIPSTTNISDVMTKPLPNDQFLGLIWDLLFRKPKFGSHEPIPASEKEGMTPPGTGTDTLDDTGMGNSDDKQPTTEVTDLTDVTVRLNDVTGNTEPGTEMKHSEAPVTVLL